MAAPSQTLQLLLLLLLLLVMPCSLHNCAAADHAAYTNSILPRKKRSGRLLLTPVWLLQITVSWDGRSVAFFRIHLYVFASKASLQGQSQTV